MTEPTFINMSRRPLPAGAVKWSKVYLDHRSMPVESDFPVPVDENDRRTPHLLHRCKRGHILVDGQKLPCDYTEWLEPGAERYCPDHGKEPLVPAEETKKPSLLPWVEMWEAVEASTRAAWFLLGETAAGVALEAAHVGPPLTLLLGPALAAGGYLGVRTYLTRQAHQNNRIEKGQKAGRRVRTIRRRARIGAYMGATAGASLTALSAVDPHGLAGKVAWPTMLVAWAVASQTWRNRVESQRVRDDDKSATVLPLPDADVDPDAVRDASAWVEDVAALVPTLKNTTVDLATWHLDRPDELRTPGAPFDRRMVIRTRRGGLTEETIKAAVPTIAGAFGIKKAAIGWVDEYDDDPKAVQLLLQPNSPLLDKIPGKPIDVVDVHNALVHMGMRQDGSDLNACLFRLGLGSPSKVVIGTTRSGKTGTVRRLLVAMLRARVARQDGSLVRLGAPFLHDPKLGHDYGSFRRQVSGFSRDSDALHMIVDAFTRELDRRYDMLATTTWKDSKGRDREGTRPFDPRTMGPALWLILDEWHENAKDQALMAKLDPFARKMGAAALGVTFATHLATIGDTGSQGFRDMCAGGEAYILRTTLGMNSALITGGTLSGDPRALPREPGFLYHVAGESVSLKSRIAYDEDEYDLLYDDGNNSLIQPVEWPQETLDAFGPEFCEWMHASQTREVGTAVPLVPTVLKSARIAEAAEAAENMQAEGVLQLILFEGGQMSRARIAEHPLWKSHGFSVTSTLTAVLRKGQDATPPWLVKLPVGKGEFDITPAKREELAAAKQEADQVREAEEVAA